MHRKFNDDIFARCLVIMKNIISYIIYKLRSVPNTGTCYPGLGWICQVHLGFGLSASAQVPDKPALAWVACPGILHRS